jgi:hypothetical protein
MDEYNLLKLSIQSALIGAIPDNLFAVTCGMDHKRITIATYFDGALTDEEVRLARTLAREVAADFSDGHSVDGSCYSVQDSELRMLDFWAFLRAGRRSHQVGGYKPPRRLAAG